MENLAMNSLAGSFLTGAGMFGNLPNNIENAPYLEVFNNLPILAIRMGHPEVVVSKLDLTELIHWVHGLQPKLDALADKYQMYKVHPHDQGYTYLFCLNPQIPSMMQAPTMLQLAWELRTHLYRIGVPGGKGAKRNWDIVLHSGTYAGAVIGTGTWTYDLYGEAVMTVKSLLSASSGTGAIMCTSEYMMLLEFRMKWRFLRHHIVGHKSFGVYAHIDTIDPRVASMVAESQDWGAASVVAPKADDDQVAARQMVLSQLTLTSNWTLEFPALRLEERFRTFHNSMLRPWDQLVVAVLCVMGLSSLLSYSSRPESLVSLLLRSLPFWLLPLLARALDRAHAASYQRHREELLLLHRVFVMVYVCNPRLLGAGPQLTAQLLRYSSVFAICDAAMFKVRFKLHLLVMAATLASYGLALLTALAWPEGAGEPAPPAPSLLQVLATTLLPAVLVFCWELEMRSSFIKAATGRDKDKDA